jgi:tripartite-type tricarboxylate transporter receptor subunit TctC
MRLNKIIIAVVSFSLILLSSAGFSAEPKYPTRAIDVVVPASPGSGSDVLTRVFAKYLSKELDQPVNVVNRAGGNGVPCVLSVMTAAPDGYSLIGDQGFSSSYQLLSKDLPYKVEDRIFICKFGRGPMALVCDPKLPWKSLDDVAKAAKAAPDKFIWGGLGGQSVGDYVQLQFFSAAGLDIPKLKKVVYQGGGQILAAVAGGHVQFGVTAASGAPSFTQSGKVRALVVSGDKRVAALSDVLSAKEAGYPNVNAAFWCGLSGPPKLPQYIVDKINAAVKKLVDSKDFIADLEKIAVVPYYVGPEEMKKEVLAEGADTGRLEMLSSGTK